MSEQAFADFAATSEDDSAEWRPYQVWASQMRPSDSSSDGASTGDAASTRNGSWDPYTVWKQQVQQGDSPKSDDHKSDN